MLHLKIHVFLSLTLLLTLTSCAAPPKNTNNICKIFKEKRGWYRYASEAAERWNSSVAMMMAIMHQESRFVQHAKPPRTKILWVLPGPRPSSAFGYAQAQDATWEWYQKDTGQWRANRHDFEDAVDFVGWYNKKSREMTSIKGNDAYSHYLAYHEGQAGFNRRTYNQKSWLKAVAKKVQRQTSRFQSQLNACEDELNKRWWWPF